MNQLTLYSITENMDKTEGRGPKRDTGIYFTRYGDALKFVNSEHYKKYAVMGVIGSYSKYDVETKDLYIYDSFDEFDEKIQEESSKKAAALNKLTGEEKKLLGL